MDLKEAIQGRRSIRKYKNVPIPQDLINEVLNAARLAPSGNNAQPWRYKVITDDETVESLRDHKIFAQDFVYDAPVIILCCADPHAYKKNVAGLDDDNTNRAFRDLGISSQNLVMQAEGLGLGTCYVGWMEKAEVKKLFGIPEHFIAPYVITLGYPDEAPKARPRKQLSEILL